MFHILGWADGPARGTMGNWPLGISVGVFVVAAAATAWAAVKLAGIADRLADRVGVGEATFGSVFFGAVTSLSGVVTTATAAWNDQPRLAYGNAVGGIAAQTAALAVADFFYRKANLEHAAASLENMLFGTLLVSLLTVAAMGSVAPDFTVLGVHPTSVVLAAAYVVGLRFARAIHAHPQWRPEKTTGTVEDVPDEDRGGRSALFLWSAFAALGALASLGGWAIATSASSISEATGLGAGIVGTVLMGVVNALPETVTSVAAVRRGALTLAVGGILGGNTFDVLNLAVGDAFYRKGSLYHAAEPDDLFFTLAALLMTSVVLAGLLRREREGFARIGTEGVLLIVIYALAVTVMAFGR